MLSPIGLPEERRDTGRLMAQLRVRPPVPGQRLSSFSGGNQQKVVLAKWLARRPSVLLLDEPTQGIDAGAKLDVLEIIRGVAEEGAAVLISSGDYEQLAQTCHRVLVFRYGAPAAELKGDELSEQRIAMAAQGSVELSLTTDTNSTEGPTR